ncbi:hypothetical protein [uncultured Tenacibaculum sp.]|uniref:hypothetical protein n=1 Tax=uncultured Tenacibaculum sp. TaxID=174713 RepID=UPI0026093FA9|nr:hypothetical protein [uncultured Tenacibaculum sp.]
MKTSLLFKLLIVPVLIFSCSNNTDMETIEDETLAVKEGKKTLLKRGEEEPNVENTYYEEDLYIFYLENTLTRQYEKKEELLLKIEEGEEDLIEKLELLQKSIKENEKALKFFRIRPRVPSLPPPPLPCPKKITSCRLPLNSYNFILLNKDIKEFSIQIKTEEGEIISENKELFPAENFEGLPAIQLDKKDFSGKVVLSITKFSPIHERMISYEINAIID